MDGSGEGSVECYFDPDGAIIVRHWSTLQLSLVMAPERGGPEVKTKLRFNLERELE